MGGIVYFNHYQHEMMMETMESNEPELELEDVEAELGSVDTVFVLITDESLEALRHAAGDGPGMTLLSGVSAENRLFDIEVAGDDGRASETAPALVVFTRENLVWPGVSFRTDTPVYVLDYVRVSEDIDHILMNPPVGITADVPDSMVHDERETTTLFWRLR